jgi:C-terminal processing protease CtpA/Prc
VIEVPDWASRAVHPGDVVMRIDGEAVRCGDHYDSVSVALPRNRDARLEILRDGEPRTVTLPARR